MPERSFFVFGKQMPVCARCFGCFIGTIIALFVFWKIDIPFIILIDMMMPLLADWLIQYMEIKQSTNIRRLITGVPCGFAVYYIYFNVLLKVGKGIFGLISPSFIVNVA